MNKDDGYGLNVSLTNGNRLLLGYKAAPGEDDTFILMLGEWREAVKVSIAIYHACVHLAREEGLSDEDIETLFGAVSDQIHAELHDK